MSDEWSDSRRAFLNKTLNSGLWGMAATSGLMAPMVHAFGKIPKRLPPGKSIYEIKGLVKVDGRLANDKTIVKADSTVETGSNSYVVFAVGQDAHIMRENSKMELAGTDLVEDFLNLVTGSLLSVFGERPTGQSHTITTSTATIGIRGTGVYAESAADHSYVCTCYGDVQLASRTDPQSAERIVTTHHDSPRIILADGHAGKLIEPGPMKNHDDEELMLVEAIVGRAPPFSSVNGYSTPRRGY